MKVVGKVEYCCNHFSPVSNLHVWLLFFFFWIPFLKPLLSLLLPYNCLVSQSICLWTFILVFTSKIISPFQYEPQLPFLSSFLHLITSPYPLLVFSTSVSLLPPCQPLRWSPAFDGISKDTGMLQWTLMELQSQREHRHCFVRRTPFLWVYPCGSNTAQRGHAWPTEEQQVCHSQKGLAVLSSVSIMSALETKIVSL